MYFKIQFHLFLIISLQQWANGDNNSTTSSNGLSPTKVSRADVEECLGRTVLRLRLLNGPFFTQQQGVQIARESMQMYLVEKTTLEQIADYFYYNYNSLGLDPRQYQILADIYTGIVQIMGNSANSTDNLFEHSVGAAINQIRTDKDEADEMIAQMEAQGKSLEQIELAVCRFSLPRITAKRKAQIVMAIAELIPPEKRLPIRDQLRKVLKL